MSKSHSFLSLKSVENSLSGFRISLRPRTAQTKAICVLLIQSEAILFARKEGPNTGLKSKNIIYCTRKSTRLALCCDFSSAGEYQTEERDENSSSAGKPHTEKANSLRKRENVRLPVVSLPMFGGNLRDHLRCHSHGLLLSLSLLLRMPRNHRWELASS